MESEHPTLQFSGIVPEEFDDPNHHATLAFNYFAESYSQCIPAPPLVVAHHLLHLFFCSSLFLQ